MAAFGRGPVWPDTAGTPTDPTTAFVASSRTLEIQEETELVCRVDVTVDGCRAIALEAQESFDLGVTWQTKSRKVILGCSIGQHLTEFSFTRGVLARVRARRYGGSAATRLVVNADSRWATGDKALGGQPLELAGHQAAGLECWGDGAGGAAVIPAGGHVAAPAAAGSQLRYPTGEADTVVIEFTTSVLAPTTIEVEVRESADGWTTELEQAAVNNVSGGVVNHAIAQEQITFGALDTRRTREIAVRPNTEIVVLAQRTGGGPTSEALGMIRFYKLGRG